MANPSRIAQLAQTVEVWIPCESGESLRCSSGDYRLDEESNVCLGESRKSLAIASGEGLVGRVWQSGSPEVQNFASQGATACEQSALERGLVNHVGIPILRGGICIAVVLFLCDDGDRSQGAIEIWKRNDRDELGLQGGFYANLDRFSRMSAYIKFPRRAGLPGITWEKRHPRIIEGIGSSKDFIRAAGARAGGLSVAVSMPIMRAAHEIDSTVLFLSSSKTPLAGVFEVWSPLPCDATPEADAEESPAPATKLRIEQASYGPYIDMAPACRQLECEAGQGIAGHVFSTGLPWITNDLPNVEAQRGDLLGENELSVGMGIPVYIGETLDSVIVMIR